MKASIEYQRKMKAIYPTITQDEIEHNFLIKKALDNDEVQAAVEDCVFWREAREALLKAGAEDTQAAVEDYVFWREATEEVK